MLRVLTCGSVDDGKSTLIGRLLWDATDLFDDQRATIERGKRVDGGNPDFSLLMDGLVAEREQGITIDIAWRYFDTAHRRFVVIDSPGHEQYTRNMASGASHADVAIMLIDARHGIKTQTRRHAAILDLVGVKRVILAVNKMDLAGWSEDTFKQIEADFRALSMSFGFWEAVAIPVAAVSGDNVASRSPHMPWYKGPSLLEHLEELPSRGTEATGPFRFPVQTVLRDTRNDFRGLAGTVSAGSVRVGETVVDALSRKSARIQRIATMDGDQDEAFQGQAVVIQLDTDIDVARGAVLSRADTKPDRCAQPRDAPHLAQRDRIRSARLLFAAHIDRPHSCLEPRDPGTARSRNAGDAPLVGLLRQRYRHRSRGARARIRRRYVHRSARNRQLLAG